MRTLATSLLLGFALAFQAAASAAGGFTVTSAEFADGGTLAAAQVFDSFGCTGGNHSPGLSWSGAPAGTKSFAVTIYDPDAPTGSGWWHWTVFNIPVGVTHLAADAGAKASTGLPAGAVQGRTDFGFSNYGGPCPPVGDAPHHYQVTVYALKVDKLGLDATASGAMVGYYLNMNSLAKTTITGLYGRAK